MLEEAARTGMYAFLDAVAAMTFAFGAADLSLREEVSSLLATLAEMLESDVVSGLAEGLADAWFLATRDDKGHDADYGEWLRSQ